MFFNRSGSFSRISSSNFSSFDDKQDSQRRLRRKRLAALSLAVAMATPVALTAVASADEAPPATGAQPSGQAPAQAQPQTPKEHYKLALQQYRSGDWINARKNFEAANGYKPGLFEGDRPDVYLARMDKKENADRIESTRHTEASSHSVAAGALQAPTTQATAPSGADDQAMQVLRDTAKADELRRQQNATRAKELVGQARAAQDGGNLDQARELYAEAVRLDPNNSQAQAGLDEVLTAQGRNPRGNAPLLTRAAGPIEERRQEINYRFDTAIGDARSATQAGRWEDAERALQQAQLAAGADRTLFNPQELRRFDQTLASTRVQIDQARDEAQRRLEAQRRTGEAQQIERERRRAEVERQHTIADLRQTAQNLTAQARYREALGVVDQILVLDPTNEYAIGVRPMLEDKYQFQTQRNFMEQRAREFTTQLNDAEEKLIPYDDILRYPTDWPDISSTRDQTVAQEHAGEREDRATQAQLDRSLPELSFEGVGFGDVVDFLRDVSGANIFVNWKSLEAANIDRTAPVTLKLRNVKFAKALNLILANVSGGATKLGYTIDDGVITISTADDLANNKLTRVYDIRDLIINIPDFTNAPIFDLTSLSNQNSGGGGYGGGGGVGGGGGFGGGGGGGGSSGGLFGNSGQNQQQNQQQTGPTRQELVDSIIKLITDTIAPDSWRDAGGSVGAIKELQGQLIVTQTPENQKALVNLLEQLREQRAIQVTVETRFLTVQRNFLEDVGINANWLFNINGNISKYLSTIPVSSGSSSFTSGPFTSVPGSIAGGGNGGGSLGSGAGTGGTAAGNSANTTGSASSSPATAAPTSLTTGFTFLDDFQVQLLLRATQASVTSTIVQAPRITLYNGQRAYVVVALEQAYVSNLIAVVGTGVSGFQPVPSTVESGVVLDVTATVSADRKYVTLTLRPQLANVVDIKQFTFQQGASASLIAGTGTGGTGGVTGFSSGSPSATIELPELQITEVNTTVTVPDGGTLLLGGQTIAGEVEKEAGVPVLSKIPFLKRLFTNRSMAKDEQVLLILVKPTILITREIEQKQFPLLSSKLGA